MHHEIVYIFNGPAALSLSEAAIYRLYTITLRRTPLDE